MSPSAPFGKYPSSMPIAIIGIGSRFPEDGSDPEAFWQMLVDGRSARTEIPKSRYNVDGFHHPDPDRLGAAASRTAHFLKEDFTAFDAPFFSITPKEAKAMDPPQRLLLEVAYEGFENAGLRIDDVKGTKTSCFIGSFTGDFKDLVLRDNEGFSMYHATGLSPSLASNRLSWFFDLKGPSVTIDTACSSSLVAFHLGCQSLRTGESEMSIVGGTNLMFGPDMALVLSGAGILSPDGKSKSFDHKANGFSRGEGIAVTVLKPLDAALRDGDTIRAVIPATASNQDGRTPGLSLPSSEAQMELIRTAYEQAGLDMSETCYVEAHGTGTAAGDPLEMAAIMRTIGAKRTSKLFVGSVKSNIGHLEGAAGIAGIIKAALVVERGLIPPNLWFEKLNPRITLNEHVEIPTTLKSWPVSGPRRASVNSFGFGGANAHVIVEDAYHYLESRGLSGNHFTTLYNDKPQPPLSNGHLLNGHSLNDHQNSQNEILEYPTTPKLLVLSSQDQGGIARSTNRLIPFVENAKKPSEISFLKDLSYTLGERRSVMPWKSFAIASNVEELVQSLGEIPSAIRSSQIPRIAFVFTGQGAQWFAMGKELSVYPAYKASLNSIDQILKSLGCDWSLHTELNRSVEESRLELAELSQPVCTAIQVALVDLLRSWDIHATAVVGHSSGEIAAAYCSGAISKESATKIAFLRGRCANIVAQRSEPKGAMMAVTAGPEIIQLRIARLTTGKVVVACINSPTNCTISGDVQAIDELRSILEEDQISCTNLKVEVAYHSPHMEYVRDEYLKALSDTPEGFKVKSQNCIPMFSSVTGGLIQPESLGPSYWVENLVSTVNFSGAVSSLLSHTKQRQKGHERTAFVNTFLEIGPHSALRGPLREIFHHEDNNASTPLYMTLLRRGHNALYTALQAMGELYCAGYNLSVDKINDTDSKASMLVNMPSYAWNHSLKFWDESHITRDYRLRDKPRLDLLGFPTGGTVEPQWRNFLRVRENPWIKDHKVQSSILYPGAGMVVMAIEGARQIANANEKVIAYELRDVYFSSAMQIPDDERGLEVTMQFQPRKIGTKATTAIWTEFVVSSYSPDSDKWQTHCKGLIQITYESQISTDMEREILLDNNNCRELYLRAEEQCVKPVDSIYEALESIGIQYGKTFQNLTQLYSGDHIGRGVLQIPDTRAIMPMSFEYPCIIHPATLDSIFHLIFGALSSPDEGLTEAVVPVSIDRLYISTEISTTPGFELHGFSECEKMGYNTWNASIQVSDESWEAPLIVLEGLGMASVGEGLASQTEDREMCCEIIWQEDVGFLSEDQTIDLIHQRTVPDADDNTLFDRLDRVCLLYMQRILEWFKSDGRGVPLGHVFSLYYNWIQDKVALAGNNLPLDSNNFQTAMTEAKDALQDSPAGLLTGALIDRIGQNLEKIFTHEIEALQVMLEGDLLYTFYRGGLGTSFNENVAEYVAMLAYKKPDISVLEIGAGTGGTTYHVLNKLRNADGTILASNYVFTDISPGFLAAAADRFSQDASVMEFTTLNIEDDPMQQGFKPESFDVIVAANVLHATKCISETLTHARSLLKPGGKLVLSEITVDTLFCGFVMGPLPGWWLGEDDGRKGGPILTVEQWDHALQHNGFGGVELCVRGDSRESNQPVSLLVSTKIPSSETSAIAANFTILSDDNPKIISLSHAIQEAFKAHGHEVSILSWKGLNPSDVKDKFCISMMEIEAPVLLDISDEDFVKLQQILLSAAGVIWLTKGAAVESTNPLTSLMVGLSRTIRNENVNVSISTLDLDPVGLVSLDITAKAIFKLSLSQSSGRNYDFEYAIRQGVLQIPRVRKNLKLNAHMRRFDSKGAPESVSFTQSQRPLRLSVKTPGLLDTLRFVEDKSLSQPLPDDWVEVQVKAVGLNFKDVLVAMGNLKEEELGIECSGIISKIGSQVTDLCVGDRVFTAGAHTFATFARFPAITTKKIPDDMSFEDAASLSLIYNTAYYSLVTVGRLEAGESVLIHAAAGGVGQAAIVISQMVGAEIFVTVGTEEKRQLVMDVYGIPGDHIFSSRDLSFAKGIMRATGGRGVDVVLNSLAGEALRLSWYCLAKFGRFLEIGKADMFGNTGLDMAPFLTNKTFAGVNLVEFNNNPSPRSIAMFDKVAQLVHEKIIKPVTPVNVFTFSEIERAFRFLQTGKHMGKIVVKVDEKDQVQAQPSAPPVSILENATYIFAGGLGGIGRSMGRWFAEKGAKHLVFLSRSAAKSSNNIAYIQDLRQAFGIDARAFNCDVGDEVALSAVLAECAKDMPPIKGLVTGAMVLRDSLFENMTPSDFKAALGPKVHGSWNLHKLLPKDLDFFIMLSSVVGIIGYRGQGNYAAGNTFQDALAQHRVSQGLRAMTIDVSWVLNVGWVAEHDEYVESVKAVGVQIVREKEIYALVATAMEGALYDKSLISPQVITGLPTKGLDSKWYWINENKFATLRNQNNNRREGNSSQVSLQNELMQSDSLTDAIALIRDALVEKLAKLMMVPAEDIDPLKPLSAYGVDSLVAVEVRNWLAREIKAEVSVFQIMENIPMSAMAVTLAKESKLLKDKDFKDE